MARLHYCRHCGNSVIVNNGRIPFGQMSNKLSTLQYKMFALYDKNSTISALHVRWTEKNRTKNPAITFIGHVSSSKCNNIREQVDESMLNMSGFMKLEPFSFDSTDARSFHWPKNMHSYLFLAVSVYLSFAKDQSYFLCFVIISYPLSHGHFLKYNHFCA